MEKLENKEFVTLHRIFAILAFLVVFIAHAMTVSPSVPFWDCAERLTAITWQQIPHPPGTPFFAMLGHLFQIIIPFGDLGWRGNMLPVTASGAIVTFLYLMSVLVIKNFRKEGINSFSDAIAVHGSAFVGAIAFGLSGTFWFNSVEAETYNIAILAVVIVMYLLMRWTQVADEKGNERYLLLSIYIIGISMGVHQLSLLVIFTMILIVYFRKYETSIKNFTLMSVFTVVLFYVIFMVVVISLPAFLAGRTATRNAAYEYTFYNSTFLQAITVLGILGVVYLLWWGIKRSRPVVALSSLGFLLVIFSYSIYAHVLIRSHANTPMNENEPKDFSALASYVGREQYGNAPMWPRRYSIEDYYIQFHNKKDEFGNYVYGQWNSPGRKPVQRKDGTTVAGTDWNNINTAGELAYLWKYQAYHMYIRYFLWNFVGRKSDIQDAGVAWFGSKDNAEINYKSGVEKDFPVRFYALPLLLGIIGLYFHFKRDPKMAFVWLCTFLVMGILTALYQNQQEPQPRERDYFYVASFMVWGMWIGLGAYALIESLSKKKMTMAITSGVLVLALLIAPVNLAIGGSRIYSRAGNYIPFDYAYNILQSVEKDAIIFTNGDNDTFTVWYLQDVAGVRRDVRICNLSLANTLWYVDQLKNRQPWGAKKIPLTFSDESLQIGDEMDDRALSYDFGDLQEVEIPVKREILEKYTDDPAVLSAGKVKFTFYGKPYQKDEKGNQIYLYRVQDKVVMDIITQTKFERPVYYSVSVGGDAMCGLEPYFKQEGLCMRVCPVPQHGELGNQVYNDDIMDKVLLNVDNSNNYHKAHNYGLKLRNLNNNTYYDDVHRRSMQVYRQIYLAYANYLVQVKKDKSKANKIIDVMRTNISDENFPMHFEMEYRLAYLYKEIGNQELMKHYAKMGIKSCEDVISNEKLRPETVYYEQMGRSYGPYNYASDLYKMLGEYDAARNTLEKLLIKVSEIKQQMEASGANNNDSYHRILSNYASIKIELETLKIDVLESKSGAEAALEEAKKILNNMRADTADPVMKYFTRNIEDKIGQLEVKLGLRSPSDTLPVFTMQQ